MPGTPLSADERSQIADALRAGGTCGQIARDFGRSKTTVSKIARDEGISVERQQTEKATASRLTYDRLKRIELLDVALDKAYSLIAKLDKPGTLQPFALGLAILIDKRRQEDDSSGSGRALIGELMTRIRQEGANAAPTADG